MCGICGELRLDGQTADLPAIGRMMDKLQRRGPDHGGSYTDGALGFGHRRLSIIDLSENSDQPMHDPALRLAVVFNGTIYNYRELRRELQTLGYRFFSEGDTEVILKAYAAWGEDCVKRFNGMFAFALWDQHQRRLFMARDRLGIKPLYLTRDNARLRFASSLPALLAAGGVDSRINPVALHHQFTLHGVVPAPHTILQGVTKLAPGTTMTVHLDGHTRHAPYWVLNAQRPEPDLSDADAIALIHHELTAAVERQVLAADVPVGVLLSGGLDSSLLVGLLAEHGRQGIHTFSVGFEDQPEEKGDEFEYSDIIASHFGTQHHRFRVPNGEMLKRLPEALANMSEPMFSQDNVAFYLLAERVSQDVKAVLSGQGADEVFGGYFWYPRMEASPGTPLERFSQHYFDRSHAELQEMLSPEWRGDDYTSTLVQARLTAPGADTFLDQVLRFDATTLIVDDPVKRVDNMTMAWGLEARVPFLDHELVEAAMKVSPALKLKEDGKHPLKAIARDILPHAVIDRPKGYFPTPALKYLRGGFLEFIREVMTSPTARQRGLFNPAYVDKMLAEPLSHFTRLNGNKLWHLASVEYWLQVNGL